MKGKFMIIAALLGALTFGACVDTEESSSVTAIRNAKAEQLKSIATLNNAKAQAEATIAAAQAQIAAAQAQLIAAQAAAINAQTEADKIANQLAAAEAEAEIAALQAQLELDLLTYQQQLLQAKLDFNKAMQQLTADEKANLEGIYTAYNTALENIATTKTAIADANAEIAKVEAAIAKLDADKNWEDVVKAAQKKVTDAQKAVTDTESKLAAKKAAYSKIESMGGINYAVLAAQIEDAEEALAAANKEVLYAQKNAQTKRQAYVDNRRAMYETDYYTLFYSVVNFSQKVVADYDIVNDTFTYTTIPAGYSKSDAEGNFLGTGFYKAVLGADGKYAVSTKDADWVALYGANTTHEDVEDVDGSYMYSYISSFKPVFEDGIAEHLESAANILSTSDLAKNLEVAELNLAAWEKASAYEDVVELYEEYLEDVKEIKAEIAEKEAQIAANNYLISVYKDTDYAGSKEEYADEIKELEEENDELDIEINGTSKKTGLVDELDELEEDLDKALQKVTDDKTYDKADAEAAIADYKVLVTAVDVAETKLAYATAYEIVKAANWETLLALYPEVEALVANDAVLVKAAYEADEAVNDAQDAYNEADEYLTSLQDIWADLASKPADSVEDMMNTELQALAAEISTLEATLKTNKKTLEDAQKAADKLAAMTEEEIAKSKDKYLADAIKAYEAEIEAKEAEIVILEQQLNVYEVELAGLTAALNDALAE